MKNKKQEETKSGPLNEKLRGKSKQEYMYKLDFEGRQHMPPYSMPF